MPAQYSFAVWPDWWRRMKPNSKGANRRDLHVFDDRHRKVLEALAAISHGVAAGELNGVTLPLVIVKIEPDKK